MFLPSGRVPAIGAGLVIFEIQQNSDTTYRVFDWNRLGLDGKPRELHVDQSLESIDFNDFEPPLVQSSFTGDSAVLRRKLVCDPLFTVEEVILGVDATTTLKPRTMQIIACLSGRLRLAGGETEIELSPGRFCLVPASLEQTRVKASTAASFLRTEAGV